MAVTADVAQVEGVAIHYLTEGQGEPLILLHGYTQTKHMWRPVIARLSSRYRVIAPDLPGIGDSDIPTRGFDMSTTAGRIHALSRSLGAHHASVVGHDIGLMVAYAMAARYPAEIDKLAVMDAFLPGIGDWESTYHDPAMWHFFFHGPTAEALVAGRERIYFDHYWNDFAGAPDHSLPEADRRLYVEAYSRPGRMRAGWGYFAAFPETARDFAGLARTMLPMPTLVLAGDKAAGQGLGRQLELVTANLTTVVLKDTGHWLLEEQPVETAMALERFLTRPGV